MRAAGQGRVYRRPGTTLLWIAFFDHGREIRESAHTEDADEAARYLAERLRTVRAAAVRAPTIGRWTQRGTVRWVLHWQDQSGQRHHAFHESEADAQQTLSRLQHGILPTGPWRRPVPLSENATRRLLATVRGLTTGRGGNGHVRPARPCLLCGRSFVPFLRPQRCCSRTCARRRMTDATAEYELWCQVPVASRMRAARQLVTPSPRPTPQHTVEVAPLV